MGLRIRATNVKIRWSDKETKILVQLGEAQSQAASIVAGKDPESTPPGSWLIRLSLFRGAEP